MRFPDILADGTQFSLDFLKGAMPVRPPSFPRRWESVCLSAALRLSVDSRLSVPSLYSSRPSRPLRSNTINIPLRTLRWNRFGTAWHDCAAESESWHPGLFHHGDAESTEVGKWVPARAGMTVGGYVVGTEKDPRLRFRLCLNEIFAFKCFLYCSAYFASALRSLRSPF